MKERKKHAYGKYVPGGWGARCGRAFSYATVRYAWPDVTCQACLRARTFIGEGGGYFNPAAMTRRQFAAQARLALQGVEYDTLVGTGLSGALAVPFLARALRKRWMIIRKPSDSSHAGSSPEGQLGQRWIFVDDFISSGATRIRVLTAVQSLSARNNWQTTFVGTYTYSRDGYQAATPEQVTEGSTT